MSAEQKSMSKRAVSEVFRLYMGEYKKHWWYFTLAFLGPGIGTVLVFYVPPIIVGQIVDIFSEQGSIALADVSWRIIAFMGVWILGEMLWRVGMHYAIKGETIGIANLGNYAFSKLTGRDYEFYTNNFVGSLTKKTIAFARNFESFTDTIMFNVVTFIGPLIFAYIILGRYSLWLPLALTAWVALGFVIAYPRIKKRAKLVTLRHEAMSKVSGHISDSVSNIMAIKSFSREKAEKKEFADLVSDYSAKAKHSWDYHNWHIDMSLSPVFVLTNATGLVLSLWLASTLHLTPGTILVVFSYYTGLSQIFWSFNRIYRNLESSLTEAAEFTELILDKPEIRDKSGARKLRARKANIAFKDVAFHYEQLDDVNDAFLQGFNLAIPSGQRIGLVGPSGGGKTTLTKLLLRFKDVLSGSIQINGQDIRDVAQSSLRGAIAYVPQEPLLFHRSIADNIRYGKSNATEKEVLDAAKKAHADEFVAKLPEGYETLVGERGVKLSGGQKQRIAIARAMLKDAPIIVLDEATSALDSESEQLIQDALWKLMKGRTTVVIAHRLSTIQHMDRIVVLNDGQIVEDGTHKELVAKKDGVYAALWNHQSGGFIE